MAITETRARLRSALDEMNALKAKPDITQEDVERIKVLLQEGKNLKAQLDLLGEAAGFDDDMAKSAGVLNLAGTKGGAQPVGMVPSGEVAVTSKAGNLLVDDEGNPVIDAKKWQAISDPAYKSAFRQYLRLGDRLMSGSALKVLQEGVDDQGGYLVPEDILNRLIAREPTPTRVAARVTRLTTGRDRLVVPRVTWTTDDLYTSGMRVTWTGEVPASATSHRVTQPVFGQTAIPIFTAMMSLALTQDMVEDSAYPLVNWCTSKFGETIDLLQDNMIINGAGATEPQGIIANANFVSADVHTTAAAALTWDGILDLLYALPEQYDSNAVVLMNKTNTALALSKLVDGNGRPYWSRDNAGFTAQTISAPLLGYPVMFSGFMPNVSAGLYPIIFGDLSGYWLVNRVGFSIQVLRELYAETNQIVLLGRVRFGGVLVEDWKVRGQVVAA